jgi:hypothetical protein
MKRKKIVNPKELEQLTELEIFQKTTEELLKLCFEILQHNRNISDKLFDISKEYNETLKKHLSKFNELINLSKEGYIRVEQKRQILSDIINETLKKE